jgi:large subunit ribosomal protein L30
MATKIKIRLIRSPIGASKRQRATVEGLGLRRMQQTVEQPNNAQIRGMIRKVSHLLEIEAAG